MSRLFVLAIGVFFANGLFETLASYRLQVLFEAFDVTGQLVAAYYFGFVLSAVVTPFCLLHATYPLVVRAYVATMVFAVVSVLLCEHFIGLLVLQWLCGFAVSGLYILVEAYLQHRTMPTALRQRLITYYMVIWYAALAVGQIPLLVNFNKGLLGLCMIIALALGFIAVPTLNSVHVKGLKISGFNVSAPQLICLVVSLLAGGLMALLLSMMPAYVALTGGTLADAAQITLSVIGGAVVVQLMLFRLDNVRHLFYAMLVMGLVGSVTAVALSLYRGANVYVFAVLLGACALPLYGIVAVSVQSLCIQPSARVRLVGYCLLGNGLGAFFLPLCVTWLTARVATQVFIYSLGLIFVFVFVCAAILLYYISQQVVDSGVSHA